MTKVNEMAMYINGMELDLHDDHSHFNEGMAFYMTMKMRKSGNPGARIWCPILMKFPKGVLLSRNKYSPVQPPHLFSD